SRLGGCPHSNSSGSRSPYCSTALQRLLDGSPWYPHDNEWVAIWFTRDPSCIPSDFDLLDTLDFTLAPGVRSARFCVHKRLTGSRFGRTGRRPSISHR